MRTINGRHWLCFFLLAFPLSWAEDTKKDVRKTENDTVWSQVKARQLFARRKISPPQESNTTKGVQEPQNTIPANRQQASTVDVWGVDAKHKSNLMSPARRCGRLMESCSAHVLCCDPCASCRCRLFNTICHCWRMNPLCLKKT